MSKEDSLKLYQLPNPATPEDLEGMYTVLHYADRLLISGFRFQGRGKPCYFGAIYKRVSKNLLGAGLDNFKLVSSSDIIFMDDGHAIEWTLEQMGRESNDK